MKIISLNVNNFGGLCGRPLIKDYTSLGLVPWGVAVDDWRRRNEETITTNLDGIVKYIKEYEIVILQEVDTNCTSFDRLKDEADKNNFLLIYPNEETEATFTKGRNSITCMLIKKNINYVSLSKNFSTKKYKNVEVQVGNLRIIGVHVPMGDLNYWNALINKYKSCKKERVLIIGDMNVCDFTTKQRSKFDELIRCGMIDSWVKKGNDMNKITCNTGKRLDYALVSNLLMQDVNYVEIIDAVRNNEYTDHSAIMVDVHLS